MSIMKIGEYPSEGKKMMSKCVFLTFMSDFITFYEAYCKSF